MSSHREADEKRNIPNRSLSLGKRFLFMIVICCIQLIYIPTSERISGGIEPKIFLDIFPVWPVWVVPYVLSYPLWLTCLLWAMFKMEERMFRSFSLALIVTCAVSVSIFISIPTYVPQAAITGSDIFSVLLRSIHENWGRYNAFPSGHIYITTLLALFFIRLYPHHKPIWIAILVVVSLSTLFTAQHYLVDILGGLLVALAGYHLGLRSIGLSLRKADVRETHLPLSPPS